MCCWYDSGLSVVSTGLTIDCLLLLSLSGSCLYAAPALFFCLYMSLLAAMLAFSQLELLVLVGLA
jgi:hypothetical protein